MMSIPRDDPFLFNDGELSEKLRQAEASVRREVENYDENRLLNTAIDDLYAYFVDQHSIEPIVLLEAETSMEEPRETQLNARRVPDAFFMVGDPDRTLSATQFAIVVPFEGEASLFQLRPNRWTSSPPRAEVRGHELAFNFIMHQPNETALKIEFEGELRSIKNYLSATDSMVKTFNASLQGIVRECVDRRRQRLLTAKNTTAALGFPIRRRGGPATYSAPTVRRKIRTSPPPASNAPYKPEPALPNEEYEHILSIMTNMATVLERSPSAFKSMGEEDLRQHFLVQLNGHYEGAATGETFNGEGKTDILIRVEGKNIFIAECKFWSGPKGFSEAIDQLLSYTTWRDTKTAIVIFNRDTQASTLLEKIPEVLKAHPNFKRMLPPVGETQFRAVLGNKNDSSREVFVAVLVFSVPR